MPWHWVNYNINISLQHKYVYIEVPKAACTTIKATLSNYELDALSPQWEATGKKGRRVHRGIFESPFIKPYQLSAEQFENILLGDEFFKFTFVRSPFSRTLACYLDKIVKKSPIDDPIRQSINSRNPASSDVNFTDFLQIISEMEPYNMNSHYRQQYFQTFGDAIRFDFIGRQESFEQDFKRARKKIGCPDSNYKIANKHKTNASQAIQQYFTETSLNLTEKIYAVDFEHFGYKRDL